MNKNQLLLVLCLAMLACESRETTKCSVPVNPAPEITDAITLINAAKFRSRNSVPINPVETPNYESVASWAARVFYHLPQQEKLKYLIYCLSSDSVDGERATYVTNLVRNYQVTQPDQLFKDIKTVDKKTKLFFIKQSSSGSNANLDANVSRITEDLTHESERKKMRAKR